MYGASNSARASACHPRLALNLGLAVFLAAASAFGRADRPVASGSAEGTFSIDGKRVPLKHAYAMTQPNPFDEKKTDTVILLTEKPLPEGALEGLKDLGDAARDLENYVLFKLDEKGVPVSEIVHHLALGDKRLQMSNTGRRRSLRDRRPDV